MAFYPLRVAPDESWHERAITAAGDSDKMAAVRPNDVMAFIRKRGESYYLVHNVRKDGRVRQIHLACLGRRPRISDDVVRGVASKHPFVRVDWKELREKASRNVVQPFEHDSRYLRDLLLAIRNLHFDLADLPLPLLELTKDRELSAQFDCRAEIAASNPGREAPGASQGQGAGFRRITTEGG